MSFDDHLSIAARRLRNSTDFPAPSGALEERVLRGVGIAKRSKNFRQSLGGLVVPVIVVAVSLLSVNTAIRRYHAATNKAPHKTIRPTPGNLRRQTMLSLEQLKVLPQVQFGTKVQQAVDRQNTYHFSGWMENQSGRQHWEIWERRKPFFFREQIGDSLVIDDGKKRTQILTGDALKSLATHALQNAHSANTLQPRHLRLIYIKASSRSTSTYVGGQLAIQSLMMPNPIRIGLAEQESPHMKWMPSRQVVEADFDIATLSMLKPYSLGTGVSDSRHPIATMSRGINLVASTGLISPVTEQITVDPATYLPIAYQMLRSGSSVAPGTVAPYRQSTIQSQTVLSAQYGVEIPRALQTYSVPLHESVLDMRPIKPSIIEDNLSFDADEIEQDRSGNVRVSLVPHFSPALKANPNLLNYLQINVSHDAFGTDEKNHLYTLTMMDDGQQPTRETMWLIPQSPYRTTDARPGHLTLHLPVTTTYFGPDERSNTPAVTTFGRCTCTAEVSLPTLTTSLPTPPYRIWQIGGSGKYSISELAAIARAKLYANAGIDAPQADTPSAVSAFRLRLNSPRVPQAAANDYLESRTPQENRTLSAAYWEVAADEANRIGDEFSAKVFKRNAEKARKAMPSPPP